MLPSNLQLGKTLSASRSESCVTLHRNTYPVFCRAGGYPLRWEVTMSQTTQPRLVQLDWEPFQNQNIAAAARRTSRTRRHLRVDRTFRPIPGTKNKEEASCHIRLLRLEQRRILWFEREATWSRHKIVRRYW
jgi:hypothetical protein